MRAHILALAILAGRLPGAAPRGGPGLSCLVCARSSIGDASGLTGLYRFASFLGARPDLDRRSAIFTSAC